MYEDTSAEERRRYHGKLRAMTHAERMAVAVALSRAVRELAEAGIRQRHPDADDREVAIRLAVRLYGRAAAERLYGTVPDDAV